VKIEPTQCSETSAFNIQTPGKYPEENIPYLQHGESFKTTIKMGLQEVGLGGGGAWIGLIWVRRIRGGDGSIEPSGSKQCGESFD
jgi:hypothetical protein